VNELKYKKRALLDKVAQSGSFSVRFVPLQRSRRPLTISCASYCSNADYGGQTALKSLFFPMAQTENLCHTLKSF
jgi:hypothetical protein